ncbi:MAG: hypothetical protein ACE5GS_04605 [Kiloniellaceae bacterium]
MTRNFGNPARIAEDLRHGELAASSGFSDHGHRRGWRGLFALGFLFVSAAAGYGLMFVLIDKWYKGGSLGIL